MKLNSQFIIDYCLIIVIYCLTHSLILLNKGIFWDDWVIYNMEPLLIYERFEQAGSPITSHIHVFLLSLGDGILSYRIATFILYLIVSLFFYFILTDLKIIPRIGNLFIVLFYVTSPMNGARISLICLPYGLTLVLFFIGFWSVIHYHKSGEIKLLLLALVTFFVSFFSLSTIIAYLAPLSYACYHEYVNYHERKGEKIRWTQYFPLLSLFLLPIIFFILKSIMWAPSGNYQRYNLISINNIFNLPFNFNTYIKNNFFESFQYLKPDTFYQAIYIIFIGFLILWVISHAFHEKNSPNKKQLLMFLLIGVFLFIIAAYPYLLAGKVASYFDWDSRHQLFIPFGLGIIIISSIYLSIPGRWKYLILSLIIASSICATQINYIDYQKDWLKQESIIEQLKNNDFIRNNSTFILNDEMEEYNAADRKYRFYEYSGWMKYAFGDESRFMMNEVGDLERYSQYFSSLYNLGNYSGTDPQLIITVEKGDINMNNPLKPLEIQSLKISNKSQYLDTIKRIIILETKSYPPNA